MQFGDDAFLIFWDQVKEVRASAAKSVLKTCLSLLPIPLDLIGDGKEVAVFLDCLSDRLEPGHVFWSEFANLVAEAFPKSSLAETNELAKQVHQLRYLISAFQADWLRQHYTAESDLASLLAYISKAQSMGQNFDLSWDQSSRLHNKRPLGSSSKSPDFFNVKVLINFHTEYILDDQGSFVLICDRQEVTDNGLINGASFNYASANNQRHWELDVRPVKRHDPSFRKKKLANAGQPFRSPNMERRFWRKDWRYSYFNPFGYYARRGRSAYQWVRRYQKAFGKRMKER